MGTHQPQVRTTQVKAGSNLSFFEKYFTVWVFLCIIAGSATLATVVGVLIEVPVMLMLVEFCKRTAAWFPRDPEKATLRDPRCLTVTSDSGPDGFASSIRREASLQDWTYQ